MHGGIAMLKEKKKLRLYLAALIVLLLAAVVLVVWYVGQSKAPEAPPEVTPRPAREVRVVERPVEKLIEVEKKISIEEVSAGLNDMGTLLTAEYDFTDVISYSSTKKLFSIELGITESSYIVSYDGVVTAGVDFKGIALRQDKDAGIITVTLPPAQIMNVDIDPESFQLHSEKTGLGNPLSVADFNSSIVELEQSAREKATERGILEKAGENARLIVRSFIAELVDPAWTIRFEETA